MTIALTDRTEQIALEEEVAAGLEQARQACEALGARTVSLPAPWTMSWEDLGAILATEVWRYHSQYAARHDRYRPAIAELVEAARDFPQPQPYVAAQTHRDAGAAAWDSWFTANSIDLVLEPTLPITPYERGPGYERGHAGGPGDPMIALTSLWNLMRMPVASLPVSWGVGVSLIARCGREAPLIKTAIDLQEHALPPPTWTPERAA